MINHLLAPGGRGLVDFTAHLGDRTEGKENSLGEKSYKSIPLRVSWVMTRLTTQGFRKNKTEGY